VPCAHPQEKLNLLLALWSQGLVHFDWVIHCMGGPMNLLRTQVGWRKQGMDFGFCFFCPNFNFSRDKTYGCMDVNWTFIRTETHSVWALQCVVLLFQPIFISCLAGWL